MGIKRIENKLGNAGQSTIEFVLTLILLLAFLLFFFQLSMVFAFGNFVHYATFMAARAYLASSVDISDQRTRARDVIVATLKKSDLESGVDKFPAIARGVKGSDPAGFDVDRPANFVATDIAFSWQEGVRYTFKSKLFLIPLAGLGAGSKKNSSKVPNSVTLTSESWLGKDPAESECVGDMQKANALYDNGC